MRRRTHFCIDGARRRILLFLAPAMAVTAIALVSLLATSPSQADERDNAARLQELARRFAQEAEARRGPLYQQLLALDTGPQGALNADPDIALMGVDTRGFPRFYTINNLISAQTISTDEVWPGGSSGLNLTGANTSGDLAVWDASAALTTHQEFDGRVTLGDSPGGTHYHSTHVAGTLVASGFDSDAKGMSYAADLVSYDWYDDESEMATAGAAGTFVSSHSYGWATGWRKSGDDFYWYGDVEIDPNEDPGFGFYHDHAADWDDVAHNAPHYLIFKSAGNDRNDYGPDPGEGHYYWDPDVNEWVWSTEERDADGGDTGYDTLPYNANSKNIVTVGAIDDIPGGYSAPGDVVMSTFSGWGPTDDGRIKPDIVTNGIGLYSAMDDADDSYESLSGTSMASPSAAGAANLLVQQYLSLHGSAMLASTLKALIIHTADEAGTSDGPDYSYGWGLMNTQQAAELVVDDAVNDEQIREGSLANGQTATVLTGADGIEPLIVTLVWTDPPGTPPTWSVDPPEPMLVNDLDLRIERVSDAPVFEPWVLDPANPADAATTGDNTLDNVEQVVIAAPVMGEYEISVTHKGTLASSQAYSLIISGQWDPGLSCDAGGSYSGLIHERIAFDGSASTDDNGTIVSWDWDFGDGAVGDGETAVHAYESGDTYTVTLCVTDDDDHVSCCETTVEILGPSGPWYQVVKNGDFGEDVSYWQENIGSNPGHPEPQITVEDVDGMTQAARVYRDTDTDGSHAFLFQNYNKPVGADDWLVLSFDVRVESHNFAQYDSWNVYPANVNLRYDDSGGNPYTMRRSFFSWIDTGTPDDEPTAWQVAEDTWVHYAMVVHSPHGAPEGNPLATRLTGIDVGSQGWSYDVAFDNVSLVHYTDYVAVDDDPALPSVQAALLPNVPNPFNPGTAIRFVLPEALEVRLAVYDLQGRLVRTLHGGPAAAGTNEYYWNGADDHGRNVASGVYHCVLRTPDEMLTRRLVMLK